MEQDAVEEDLTEHGQREMERVVSRRSVDVDRHSRLGAIRVRVGEPPTAISRGSARVPITPAACNVAAPAATLTAAPLPSRTEPAVAVTLTGPPPDTEPRMISPVALARSIAPAPVAVAVKLAPFVSVTNTPPEPALAVTDPAVVPIGVPATPIPLAPAAGVVSITVPAPVSRIIPGACVIDPPVALPPVSVATAMVPPAPVPMLPRTAPPVPPRGGVDVHLHGRCARVARRDTPAGVLGEAFGPAPLVLALIVIVLEPSAQFASSTTVSPLVSVIGPLPVLVAPWMAASPSCSPD